MPRVPRSERPWGYEAHGARTEHYCASILHLFKDHMISWPYPIAEENLYLLSGRLLLETNSHGESRKREMLPGEAVSVTCNMACHIRVLEDSQLIKLSGPECDVVRRL